MKNTRKILAVILSVLMLMSVMVIPSFARTEDNGVHIGPAYPTTGDANVIETTYFNGGRFDLTYGRTLVPTSVSLSDTKYVNGNFDSIGLRKKAMVKLNYTELCPSCGDIAREFLPDIIAARPIVTDNPNVVGNANLEFGTDPNTGYPCLYLSFESKGYGTATVAFDLYCEYNAPAETGWCDTCGRKISAPAVDWTCKTTVCNVTVVNNCDHANTEVRNAVAATCDTEGYTGDTYCKDCGELVATGTTTAKNCDGTCGCKNAVKVCAGECADNCACHKECAHANTEVRNAVAATCDTEGYTGDTYCKDCGALVATGTTTAKHCDGTCGCKNAVNVCGKECADNCACHQPCVHANTEVRNAVAATCDTTGYTGDTYCKDCGALVATGTTTAKNCDGTCGCKNDVNACSKECADNCACHQPCVHHDYKWVDNGDGTHDGICQDCNKVVVDNEDHIVTNWTVTKAPTCVAAGEKTGTCIKCGATVTETIPATGKHDDADNDHYCDTCGDKLSDCEDNNHDHKCDTCGDKLSDCVDNNNDGKCDICGKDLGTSKPSDDSDNLLVRIIKTILDVIISWFSGLC